MTDWQSMYREGNTPWDKGDAHPALAEVFQKTALSGRVLVPGCGFGHDLAPIASQGAAEVVGLDIAPDAVAEARRRLGGNPAISIAHGDLFALPPGWIGSFDAAWEHTCYCAINPSQRENYVESISAAVREGGLLAAVFYLRPWDPDEDQDQGPPFGTSAGDLDRLFNPFFDLEAEWVPAATYPGREGKELVRLLRRRSRQK